MTETVDQAQAQPPRTLADIIGGRLCASGRTRPQSGRTAAARSMAVVIIYPVWMWLSAAVLFGAGFSTGLEPGRATAPRRRVADHSPR